MPSFVVLRRWWWLPVVAAVAGWWLLRQPPPAPVGPPAAGPLPAAPRVPRTRPGALASALGSEERTVALADFNGDGHLDLATTNGDPEINRNTDPQGAVTLWWGDGRGGLRHGPLLTDTEATLLAALDADGDGDADLLAGSCCRSYLLLWRNDGRGHFRADSLATEGYMDDMAVGDIDGDGDPDVVEPFGVSYRFGINDGSGCFDWRQQRFRAEAWNLFDQASLADMDADGDLDLVAQLTMPYQELRMSVLFNDGSGCYEQEHLFVVESLGIAPAIGDVNGDAWPDLVISSGGDRAAPEFLLNDGTGRFAGMVPQRLTDSTRYELQGFGLGDVDGDGDLDIVASGGVDDVWVYPNDGRAHFGAAYYAPTGGTDPEEVLLADLDHDQRLELLAPVPPARPRPGSAAPYTLYTMPPRPIPGAGPPPDEPPPPPPVEEPIYTQVDQMPTLVGGGAIIPWLREQALNLLILADDDTLPADSRLAVQLVVEKDGSVHGYRMLQRISENVDGMLTGSLGNLPRLVPGRRHGRPVRVALTLAIEPMAGPTPPLHLAQAQRLEAQTRRLGRARRRPGETDAAFVRRVLPVALTSDGHLLRHAWRPGAFGPQLFLTTRGGADNEYGTDLLVLDPYQPNTYALTVLPLGSMGDLTNLEALFFADVDHDGRQELLALKECSLRDVAFTDKHGHDSYGHFSHYQTDIFRLAGPDPAGRPRYQPDTTARPYLDELPTAADVRQALAKHASARKARR